MVKKTIIYFVFFLHLIHLAQAQQSQSDLVGMHVQLIPITDSAAFKRCSNMSVPGTTTNPKKKITPSKPIECYISFEVLSADSASVPILWCAFGRAYYSYGYAKYMKDFDTEKNGTNLREFIDTLKHSSAILENPEGEFRILYGKRGQYDRRISQYDGVRSCAGEELGRCLNAYYSIYDEKLRFRTITKIDFFVEKTDLYLSSALKGGAPGMEFMFSFDDLRVKPSDTSCRMHYVYILSEKEFKEKGFKRMVYTSNWFPLNEE